MTKAIMMPGKERPANSQSRIKSLLRRSFTIRMLAKNTKSSDSPARKPSCRGSRSPILPEPTRVLGPRSLRKPRPRRSDYYRNTQSPLMNINAWLLALQSYTPAR
jgi:hypothetical protein